MNQLAYQLFREVSADFFGVSASPFAGLYGDVLDALEREAAQRNQGLDRDETLALVQHVIEDHVEIAELEEDDVGTEATLNGKERSVLETLRRAGWLRRGAF